MNRQALKMNISLGIAGILLILVLLTSSMISGYDAAYVTQVNSGDSARVAKFRVGSTATLNLDAVNEPNTSQEIEITITSGETEVDTNYTLSIEAMGTLPLTYTLDTVTKNAADNVNTPLTASVGGKFEANVTTSTPYTLTVSWPAGEDDPAYACGGAAAVKLTVRAEQVN